MSPEEFRRLFTANHGTIVRFIAYRIGDQDLAEDLAADVFRIAWEKQDDAEITAAWLFTTARNRIGNEYQRRKRLVERNARLVTEMSVAAAETGTADRDADLLEAMGRLKPADQLVLHLTYWDGLGAADVATFLDCSVPTVWARLSRARASLRTMLADLHTTTRRGGGTDG